MPLTTILLAAGYATRLYPLTEHRPKALLPLGEGVLLDHIVSQLGGDVTKRILVTNHRFVEQFRQWQRRHGSDVILVDDGTDAPDTRLGAIRDLELARAQGGAEGDLLVIGTDNLFTWSLASFITMARRHAPHPSIALWEASSTVDVTPFGVVLMDANNRLTSLVEKSPTPPSRIVSTCVYYFPEAMCGGIRTFIDEGVHTDAPGHFIKWLVERGPVYGVRLPGSWYDIGTLDAYQQLLREWPVPTKERLSVNNGGRVS